MKLKLAIIAFALLISSGLMAQQQTIPFASELAAFKYKDDVSLPKPGGILFIGSSSIRKWQDLQQRFADKPIVQRGVGGSELWQWIKFYMPDLVYRYQPKKIFIYVGENDIAAGHSAQMVYQDFITMMGMIRQNLPAAKVYFLAIKQSPSRAKTYADVLQADSLIAAYLKGTKNAQYVDVNTPLINAATGQPDTTLFLPDMLHLNSKGYDKWQAVLKKYVK